jgi:hypothetical protein
MVGTKKRKKPLNNKELQKKLDEEKWIESEQAGTDRSGLLTHCKFCLRLEGNFSCGATQEEREKGCLCAKAFKAMKREGVFSKL